MKKQFLSLLLILCMIATIMPTAAFAAGESSTATSATKEQTEQDSTEDKSSDKKPEAEEGGTTPSKTEEQKKQDSTEDKGSDKKPEAGESGTVPTEKKDQTEEGSSENEGEVKQPEAEKDQAGQGGSENKDADKQPYRIATPTSLQTVEDIGKSINGTIEIEIADELQSNEVHGYTVEKKTDIPAGDSETSVKILKITKKGSYKLTQNDSLTDKWCVEIEAKSGTVDLTLSGMSLDVSDTGNTTDGAWVGGIPALAVTGECETVITLDGENTLKSGALCAGLENGTHKLTIKGDGTLNATGGQAGAGIGGGAADGGNITIENGTVNATGGDGGAGIGGGQNGSGSNITIKDGEVIAKSTPNGWNRVIAAGIGGGFAGNGSDITISGGTVNATGGAGAGIGGGGRYDNRGGEGSNIEISGGTVTAIGAEGAGIGGGQRGDGHNIAITGGNVTAKAHDGANIGGGQCADGYDITISGSTTITVADTVGWGKSSADIGGGSGYDAANAPGTGWDITIGDGVTFKKSENETVDKSNLTIGNSASGVSFLVNDDYHTSAEQNLSSLITDGVTVKLLKNVELKDTESITVSESKNFTLDLNGFTISQKKYNSEKNHSMITNFGTLTITDSSTGTKGEIKYTDTNETYSSERENVVSNTITNNGTLTITGGCTITNASGRAAASSRHPYAIDNRSGSSEASLTIKDAKVNTVRCPAIRLFCNSVENNNTVNISGSTIKGSIEYQNPKSDDTKVSGSLTIESGSFPRNEGLGTSVYVFDGTDTKNITDCSGMTCSISDGDFYGTVTFDGTVKGFNGSTTEREPFITGGRFHNGTRRGYDSDGTTIIDVPFDDTDPSRYVVGNGMSHIVKREGDEFVKYIYTVLEKKDLTSGVYLTDPSDALAPNYYVSSTENGVWTVSRKEGTGSSDKANTSVRNREWSGSDLPYYVVKDGKWFRDDNGRWFYYAADRTYTNEWAAIMNPYANKSLGQSEFDWFRFGNDSAMMTGWYTDVNKDTYYLNPVSDNTLGRMFTGWNWIDDNGDGISECYYFQNYSDGRRGRLYRETTTPDGYTVNDKGQWTVDGVVQTRK